MSEDGSMQEHMDQVVLATVRPLSLGFGLYIAYTAFREFDTYTGLDLLLVFGADVVVATYLLGLAAWLWFKPPRLSWMNGLGASIALALGGTDMVTMAVNGIPAFPATALVFAGVGAVVLSWRWLLATMGVLWVTWITLALVFAPEPWAAQFTLQVASITGIAIHWGRLRAYRGLIDARLNEQAARRRLQAVNEELDRFASVVAHDLQNPVTAIRLKAATLRIRAGADEAQQATIAELDRVADGMSHLITDLLAYARAGEAVEATQDVPLDEVMAEVQALFAERIEAEAGHVDVGPLPTVRGDRTSLFQLMENLVGNAVTYRRPGVAPHIWITSTQEGAFEVISVQDNGIGFVATEATRLFQPFERGDVEAPGHGLGLATCRRIVQRHGGRIEATSEPGRGSLFTVWLPRDGPSGSG